MFPPEGRSWDYLPSGKPFFPDSNTDLSLSHSENITVCQISDSLQCGIDIQHLREKIIRVKEKFLNPVELDFVNVIPADEQAPLLTAMWSCKEALFKMYGVGFIDYVNLFTIHPFAVTAPLIRASADLGEGLRDYYFRLFITSSFVLVFHHGLPKLNTDDIIHLPHF
jgi:phosphopantetheinyl transferase